MHTAIFFIAKACVINNNLRDHNTMLDKNLDDLIRRRYRYQKCALFGTPLQT